MEKPLATYRPAAVSKAFLGQQARLFCEAFVGHISLPDASSEVIWTKMGNESFMDSRMHLEHVQRWKKLFSNDGEVKETVEKWLSEVERIVFDEGIKKPVSGLKKCTQLYSLCVYPVRAPTGEGNSAVIVLAISRCLPHSKQLCSIVSREKLRQNGEGAQIVGAYLIIEDVQSTDFGTYLCTISNTGDQKIVMTTRLESWRDPSPPLFLWRGVVTILFCTSLTIVGLVLVIYTFKLISKENRVVSSILGKILEKSPFADSTPKKLGLVLLYGDEDAGIVESSVIPELKEKYSYNVFPQKLTSEGTVSDESKELINKVGRVMVVLTEKVVKEWTEFNVVSALQKIIPPQQHCILTAEPSPENFGNQQSQRGNFDFEKYIERYKVVMWSGDSGESKNELSSPSQGDKPADNSLQPPPVDERRKDAKSFLAKVHLTRSKKEPSPEAHV
ncbi:hypothetical protein AAG570_010075 [Ranatra chinensis]|uniref:Ig-like domain-containing protein n=1 Tax=Ranatra chinensis TaxID=642074 RepID=A0ABD0YXP0_9HEMI